MKIIELDLMNLFEDLKKDQLIAKMAKDQQNRYIDAVLNKMHELVKLHGDKESLGGYAFTISNYLGQAISPRTLEKMYRQKYMNESLNEDGRIVKGVNTTVDVGPNEIKTQAAKFGNTVDKDGRPPTINKKIKGKSTNVLYNLGLTEGYKLQLERDKHVLVLNITNTKTGQRTEVRGKLGYETNGYDPNDELHQLLDTIGKSANISELINGEVVTINPHHPDADKAKAATDRAYNERFTPKELAIIEGGHTLEDVPMRKKNNSDIFNTLTETSNLFELFDKSHPWNWIIKDADHYQAQFKSNDNNTVTVDIVSMSKGSTNFEVGFKKGDSTKRSGSGDEFSIFATVISIINTFLKLRPDANSISFVARREGKAAEDPKIRDSRASLYKRMVQKFAEKNNFEYTWSDVARMTEFIIARKNKDKL